MRSSYGSPRRDRPPKVTPRLMTDSRSLGASRYQRTMARMELLCLGAKRIRGYTPSRFSEERHEGFGAANSDTVWCSIDHLGGCNHRLRNRTHGKESPELGLHLVFSLYSVLAYRGPLLELAPRQRREYRAEFCGL